MSAEGALRMSMLVMLRSSSDWKVAVLSSQQPGFILIAIFPQAHSSWAEKKRMPVSLPPHQCAETAIPELATRKQRRKNMALILFKWRQSKQYLGNI